VLKCHFPNALAWGQAIAQEGGGHTLYRCVDNRRGVNLKCMHPQVGIIKVSKKQGG
jgi:hypothetical protein